MMTPRQIEALSLVAHGRSIDQAADEMGVCRSTVEKLLSQAKQRLNAANLRNAVYKAARMSLIIYCAGVMCFAEEARRPSRVRSRRQEMVIM